MATAAIAAYPLTVNGLNAPRAISSSSVCHRRPFSERECCDDERLDVRVAGLSPRLDMRTRLPRERAWIVVGVIVVGAIVLLITAVAMADERATDI